MQTRNRIYGSDTPFCEWMRRQSDLPACSRDCGFVATDNDITIHRYLTQLRDSVGTRDIQALMYIEIKTRNGEPTKSQRDTLRKIHLFRGTKTYQGQHIRFWGYYILSMSGTDPDNSSIIRWGRFQSKEDDKIIWTQIDIETLKKLLRFDVHPDNFTRRPFRRHHTLDRLYILEERMPLGFITPKAYHHKS